VTRVNFKRPDLATLVAIVSLHAAPTNADPFIGQFELKTLESAPGSYEFQSQNAWAWDQPARKIETNDTGELEMDENALFRERYALELEMGLTYALKMRVGVELENERIDDADTVARADDFEGLQLEEIGAEIIAVLLPREGDGAGLGFVAELEGPIDQEGPNSLIVGPIVEYRSGAWFLAAIPMAVRAFGGETAEGEDVDNKWDFAYAAQLLHHFSDTWAVALEGYGTVDRLGSTGRPSAAAARFGDFDQHRLGPVVYYARPLTRTRPDSQGAGDEDEDGPGLTIGLGLLEGLSSNTADHTLKLSIELDF
jgi:hypothetical protein